MLVVYTAHIVTVVFVVYFHSAISDPRPGHDLGRTHQFSYDFSYWSMSVSYICVGIVVVFMPCSVPKDIVLLACSSILSSMCTCVPNLVNIIVEGY